MERVLDPDGFYWRYPGDEVDDSARTRPIVVRHDVPAVNRPLALASMTQDGWQLADAPDDNPDELHRLYFRQRTALTPEDKTRFLTAALSVAHNTNGTLMTWINVKDLEDK